MLALLFIVPYFYSQGPLIQVLHVLMVMFALLVDCWRMREEWSSVIKINGVLYAITPGVILMLMLYVDS